MKQYDEERHKKKTGFGLSQMKSKLSKDGIPCAESQ
jgi:hypothetical protein